MIDQGLADSLRGALAGIFMPHTYTLTPDKEGSPTVDPWGNDVYPPGTAVPDKPCRYVDNYRTSVRDEVTTLTGTPVLLVPYDDTINEGDSVSNVRDSAGNVLLAGPAVVDNISPVAGFGIMVQKLAILRRGGAISG